MNWKNSEPSSVIDNRANWLRGKSAMAAEKILIVEDNVANMELASDLLDVAGYCVLQATTAETGIETARRELPDLILMDEGLPGMDGLTAAKLLRREATTSAIPIVMVTAHAMKGDRERALSAGCAGHVTKPIDTRTFSSVVAGFLGSTHVRAPRAAAPAAVEYSPLQEGTARRHHILIVDDEAPNRDLLEGLIESFGHDSITAGSGPEALEKISPEIDLVLLDVMMPGMDGFEVVRQIRSRPDVDTIPIVMATALTEKEDRLRAVEAGANDFITKPIDKTELKVRLDSQLRIKEAQDEVRQQREELRRRNAEMEADLDLAREIQQAFLPQQYVSFPRVVGPLEGALRFHHRYLPASTLGGDFTDILILSETEAGMFICDVMGHGVRSALITAVARGLVEELLPRAFDPGRFLSEFNHSLTAILGRSRTPMFATSCFLVADVAAGTIRYANAGHPTPLRVRRQKGRVEPLPFESGAVGPALGVFPDYEYSTCQCDLEDNDLVMLFTDGLYEVEGENGCYDEDQLREAVQRRMALSASPLFDALLGEVQQFAGGQPFLDDVCIVGMEVTRIGSPGARKDGAKSP
jgi:sigma-B regulation protein RsbU (phosphoserine phosphatase)